MIAAPGVRQHEVSQELLPILPPVTQRHRSAGSVALPVQPAYWRLLETDDAAQETQHGALPELQIVAKAASVRAMAALGGAHAHFAAPLLAQEPESTATMPDCLLPI